MREPIFEFGFREFIASKIMSILFFLSPKLKRDNENDERIIQECKDKIRVYRKQNIHDMRFDKGGLVPQNKLTIEWHMKLYIYEQMCKNIQEQNEKTNMLFNDSNVRVRRVGQFSK